LHSSPTSAAATDGNIKASPDGLPHHLVLILRLNFLYGDPAPAKTATRDGHRDHFIDLLGNGLAVTLAVGGAGFAPRWLRLGFPVAARKGCGLSLVGPLSFFQMKPAGWKLFGHAMFELSQLNVTEVAEFVQRNFQNLFTKGAPTR